MKPKAMHLTVVAIAMLVTRAARAEDITGKIAGVADRENVVVYLEKADGKFEAKDHMIMDQKNMVFIPHVLPVLSGTTVDFPNSDTVRHNVYSTTKAKKFNLGIYPVGVTKSEVMDIPGAQVVPLLCAIHPPLASFIVVLQNPYFTMANKDGSFTIKNVPAGTYTVVAWHEKQDDGELPRQKLTVGAKGATVDLTFKKDHGRSGN